MYKYKIDECLMKLNVVEYSAARKIIPKVLGVSVNTFHNYRNIKSDEAMDIPYTLVRKLELLFELKREGLENFDVRGSKLKSLIYNDPNKFEP